MLQRARCLVGFGVFMRSQWCRNELEGHLLKDKIQANVMDHFRENSKRSKMKSLCSPKISHLSSRGVELLRGGKGTLISKKNKVNATNT